MTLSLREKILVYFLLLVLAVFAIYKFAYLPISADYKANELTLQDLKLQTQLQKEQKDKYADVDTCLAEAKEAASVLAEPFFPSLEPEKLNLWLDDYINLAELTVDSILISEPAVVPIGEVLNRSADISYPLQEYAQAFLLPQESDEEASDTASGEAAVPEEGSEGGMSDDAVLGAFVNLSLTGSVSGLNAFCDAMQTCGKTVLIRAMSYTLAAEEEGFGEQAEINMTLVFYAVPKATDTVFN